MDQRWLEEFSRLMCEAGLGDLEVPAGVIMAMSMTTTPEQAARQFIIRYGMKPGEWKHDGMVQVWDRATRTDGAFIPVITRLVLN